MNRVTQGLNSEEEAEKCPAKNAVDHHTSQPREARKGSVQFSKCERRDEDKTEASAEHTSPL